MLLMQLSLAVQLEPADRLGAHTPPLQKSVAMQSASLAQLVLQPPTVQTYGEHDVIVPALQLPRPSQVLALVCVSPLHDGAAHVVPAAYS